MPNSLRHDLDNATPEEQAIHLALQREIEMDLTGYATEKWVKAQGYVKRPEIFVGTPNPNPDIDLDGYATIEYSDTGDKAVEDASVIRDEAIQKKFDDESTLNTAAHLRLDGDINALSKRIDTKLTASGDTMTGTLTCAKPGTGNVYVFSCKAEGLGENQVAFRVTGDGAVKAGHSSSSPFLANASNDVVTKAYLDQAISGIDIPEPELPEPAPRLPGFTWNYKEYADEGSAPVTSGEFTWDKEESTFYISCISGCGVLLGKQQSSFNDFITQALMTIYDQDLGLCALVQVLRIEIKSYAGQHYFKILRGGQARQTLSTGKSYNITLSGVF